MDGWMSERTENESVYKLYNEIFQIFLQKCHTKNRDVLLIYTARNPDRLDQVIG